MMVTIIGAGLAGLACARRLTDNNIPVRILEKSNVVGGRVQSSTIDGFLVDIGFQVLLNSYPALSAFPELACLQVHAFPPGARIIQDHRLHTLSDPFRNPVDALPSIVTPVVSIQDKLLMWQLSAELNRRPLESLWDEPDQTILRFLSRRGFSNTAIELFFRPFIGGITLDESLGTSATVFKFIWSMLSSGLATAPAGGMQAIPNAMRAVLSDKNVEVSTNTTVNSLSHDDRGWKVQTDEGSLPSDLVVIASDIWSLPDLLPNIEPPSYRSQRAVWLSIDRVVEIGPSLILNPDVSSPLMTVAPMHTVAPDRAPSGMSLFALTVRRNHFSVPTSVIIQSFKEVMLCTKLINAADNIACVDDQFIERAQFVQNPHHFQNPTVKRSNVPDGLLLCGEHLNTSSINGALTSGLTVADEIVGILCNHR